MWNEDPAGQIEKLANYLNDIDAVDEDCEVMPVADQIIELHNDYRRWMIQGSVALRALGKLQCDMTGGLCSEEEDPCECNPCEVWREATAPREHEPAQSSHLRLVPDLE